MRITVGCWSDDDDDVGVDPNKPDKLTSVNPPVNVRVPDTIMVDPSTILCLAGVGDDAVCYRISNGVNLGEGVFEYLPEADVMANKSFLVATRLC